MKGKRTTTLAPGVVWVLPREQKNEVPLKWKLAAQELGKQFHRVNVTHWSGILSYQLGVEVFRDEDTLNPNHYDIIVRNQVMYRQERRVGGTLWPIYPEKDKQIPPEPPRARGGVRRRAPRVDEVREDILSNSTHAIFCERAEIKDDLKALEMKFERKPEMQDVMALNALRGKLTQIEMRIVAAAIAEQMQKDLAS